LQDRVAPRWVCLQPQGPYLTSATVLLCLPASSPDPLPHISTLAGQVSPLSAALCARLWIPVAFRLAPFASWGILSSWGIVPPLRLAYWPVGAISDLSTRPQEGFHVPHRRDATGVGALYTPGPWCPSGADDRPSRRAWGGIASQAMTHHSPPKPSLSAIQGYGASSRVHSRSPCQSSPNPVRVDGSPAP